MVLLQLGPLGSPPELLVGLVVLAAVLLIGRFLLNLAWRLVVLAILVVGVLWLLGLVGIGVLSTVPV